MGLFIGIIYCLLWYLSILAGYAISCPLFPILFISNKFYRRLTDLIFTYWQFYPTALLEIICNCHVKITGDSIGPNQTNVLIMNHRTRTDWTFIWPFIYHSIQSTIDKRLQHPMKFVLKDAIRHIPGSGWAMQIASFLFVRRDWSYDQHVIRRTLDYYKMIDYKYTLLIFPEGTDLTRQTKARSDAYADKMGFAHFNYCLHPHTTGFVNVIKRMLSTGQLDAIYDLTLAYPDCVPQNERILLAGQFPKCVRIHSQRYPHHLFENMNETTLEQFIIDKWQEKEIKLKNFYENGDFSNISQNNLKQNKPIELWLALIIWTILPLAVIYMFLKSYWFRLIIIIHSLFVLLAGWIWGGFQLFEINLNQWRI